MARRRRPWTGSLVKRSGRQRIYVKVKVDGQWVMRATPYRVGQEAKAQAMLDVMSAELQGLPSPGTPSPVPSLRPRKRRGPLLAAKVANPRCEACGWAPPAGVAVSRLNAHHVRPRAKGGSDDPANLIVLCPNDHALAHALEKEPEARTRNGLLRMLREVATPAA